VANFIFERKASLKHSDKCDQIVFGAPRVGRAKRREAQAVREKQLELCRADMSFPKTNFFEVAKGVWHLF
jgi:hypothetical protein